MLLILNLFFFLSFACLYIFWVKNLYPACFPSSFGMAYGMSNVRNKIMELKKKDIQKD
jgi:hypothetical protein